MQDILKPSLNIRFPDRFPGQGAQLPGAHLITALNWRYAVKQFDPARKITSATWATLEEALRLSPSSLGLQPWKFVVVTDAEVKEKLVEHSYGQRQIADCSHLLVIAARSDYTPTDTAQFISHSAQVRGVEASSLSGFASMINGSVTRKTPAERQDGSGDNAISPSAYSLPQRPSCASMCVPWKVLFPPGMTRSWT